MSLRNLTPSVQALLLLGCFAPAACSDNRRADDDEDAAMEVVADASAVLGTDAAVGQPEFPNEQLDSSSAEQLDSSSGEQLDAAGQQGGDASAEPSDAASQPGADASTDGAAVGSDGAVVGSDGGLDGGPSPTCRSGNVDLLFVIDNSGSMAEEQKKLAAVLPQLVTVLTTGELTPAAPSAAPDFPPVNSLHVGVISADLGVNLVDPSPASCGTASFNAIAPDPSNDAVRTLPPINGERLSKPFGDDGVFNVSSAVAVAGIWARPGGTSFATPVSLVVQPDPSCASQGLSGSQRFLAFNAGSSDAAQFAQQFGCLAKLGKNGCGIEQQLEAMLKAVTPSSSPTLFSRNSHGRGDLENGGFLREDATLVVVVVTDEEDCSIPDSSSELFNARSTVIPEDINIRCGLAKYENLLQPVSRYVDGLRALKPAAQADRIIFAGIVGVPVIPGQPTFSGSTDLQTLLSRPDMLFVPRTIPGSGNLEATPSCTSTSGDGTAAPARRLVQVAQQFGANGLVTSICQDEYGSAMAAIAGRIAIQQQNVCSTAP